MKSNDINQLFKLLNKIFVTLAIIVALITINIVVNISKNSLASTDSDTDQAEVLGDYEVSSFKEVAAKDIEKETTGQKTVVYIGRESCSWCVKYVPNLSAVITEHNVKTLYIDIAKIINFSTGAVADQAAYDKLANLPTAQGQEEVMDDFGATPMTLIIENGTIIAGQTGYVEQDAIVSFLKTNKVISG